MTKSGSPRTTGIVLHWAARYDLLVWLLTLGREGAFRERLLALARLTRDETVLDVGCGTGTLAIAAKRHVDPGSVHGVDASPEMIDRAKRKAAKAGAEVVFEEAIAEALPFADARFDVVLNTVMLHHLPAPARLQCVQEMARVLKPRGRLLAVDFAKAGREHRGLGAHLHRHGGVDISEIIELVQAAGLSHVEHGPVGIGGLQFVLALKE